MNNRRLLRMEIVQRIDHRSNEGYGFQPRKPPLWLPLPQYFKARSLDIFHEQIHTIVVAIVEHMIDTWKCLVVKPPQQCTFKDESTSFAFILGNDLFENKLMGLSMLDALIAHQVN